MFRKIKQWPRDIREGIKNLIIWFPVIWSDRNWDHQYIYMILRHKLHLTEQLIRNHGHHVKHIEDADKIKKCVILLDRLIKDEYHENIYKHYYEKWGQPEMIFIDLEDRPGYSTMHMNYPNVKTEEDEKLQEKEHKIKIHKEQEMRNQDLDLLFKLMRKHIQSWWD